MILLIGAVNVIVLLKEESLRSTIDKRTPNKTIDEAPFVLDKLTISKASLDTSKNKICLKKSISRFIILTQSE